MASMSGRVSCLGRSCDWRHFRRDATEHSWTRLSWCEVQPHQRDTSVSRHYSQTLPGVEDSFSRAGSWKEHNTHPRSGDVTVGCYSCAIFRCLEESGHGFRDVSLALIRCDISEFWNVPGRIFSVFCDKVKHNLNATEFD